MTRDGARVRTGLLYRSAGLGKLRGGDVKTFGELGIRSVYDMRTEAERTAEPDRVPDGVEHVVVDVLADSSDAAPAQLLQVLGGRGDTDAARCVRRRRDAGLPAFQSPAPPGHAACLVTALAAVGLRSLPIGHG